MTEHTESVSLSAFAAVRAGVGEGHELSLVLACEQVDPALWKAAERAWEERLATDAEGEGALGEAFDEHLADARERYGRLLPPLDEDLAAWLDFHRRFSTDANPPALLSQLGVRPAEVARLHRTWSRRMAADPALFARMRDILQSEPGPLPVPEPAARVLEAPPPREPAKLPEPPALASAEDEGDEGDAPPLFVPLPRWDTDVTPAPKQPPAPAIAVVEPIALDYVVETLPETPSPLRAPALPFVPAAAAPPLPPTIKQPPPRRDMGQTLDAPMMSPFAALPFPAKPEPKPSLDHTVAAVMSPFARMGELPFTKAAVQTPPESVPKPAAPAEPRKSPDMGKTTAVAVISPFALPFAGPAPETPTQTALPTLTLEQYASLCSELSVFAARQEAIFERYGLASRPLRATLNTAWTERLQKNPTEYAQWQALYRRYHAYWSDIAQQNDGRQR